jgi:hypothetical protein
VDQSHPHPLDPILPNIKHHVRFVRQFEMFPVEADNVCEDCDDQKNCLCTSRLDLFSCSCSGEVAIVWGCHISVTATTWRSTRDVQTQFRSLVPSDFALHLKWTALTAKTRRKRTATMDGGGGASKTDD